LSEGDVVAPSLRTHAAFICRGVPLPTIYAEAYHKSTGVSNGKWSYHHLASDEHGVMLTSGVIGGSILPLVGAGLAAKLRGSGQVAVSFFGDGASSRGECHVAINMAAVFDCPVVFVVENNQYAWTVPISKQTRNPDIADRAIGYGIPGVQADGQDVLNVYHHARVAVERARRGEGPTLLECKTYRFRGHMEVESPDSGRPVEELTKWRSRDPLAMLEQDLRERDVLDDELVEEMERSTARELDEAVEYAESSPEPDPREALVGVYGP
jgi:pyruvate dehydrogenase E1 component alpha subunit